ncbi:hypothetical protein J6500_16750 [Bradyrhizobium sp. WSM 1704]|uniref:hypothetical protein n=1 Tax=Bradyrhizobium semiaridum TaxID=2821404 RepID=UPI001CE3671E|nr:hypothetical protein [Bradyrhizobium semiaridum]MCA6123532.1 hypothetical protein [Bradyrhizobium semiaridum]
MIIQKYVCKQKHGDEGFKRKYDLYLAGPVWAAKRAKVLDRAGGMCEGCRERSTTQVHHITYLHIYKEFLFQLIAVCNECHERLHKDKNTGDETGVGSGNVSEWKCTIHPMGADTNPKKKVDVGASDWIDMPQMPLLLVEIAVRSI